MDKDKKQLHDLARQIHNLKKFFFKKNVQFILLYDLSNSASF